jgi:hypothetical protein
MSTRFGLGVEGTLMKAKLTIFGSTLFLLLWAAPPVRAADPTKPKGFPDDVPLFYCNGDTRKPCHWHGDKVTNENQQQSAVRVRKQGNQLVITFLDWNNLEGVIDPNLRAIVAKNGDVWIASDSIFLPGRVFYMAGEQHLPTHFELRKQILYAVNERKESTRIEFVSPTEFRALDRLDKDGKPLTVVY